LRRLLGEYTPLFWAAYLIWGAKYGAFSVNWDSFYVAAKFKLVLFEEGEMSEFVSTFITGFGNVVLEQLFKDLPGIKVIALYDGLIHYRYNGNYRIIKKLVYLNNTFSVILIFQKKNITFDKMINLSCKRKYRLLMSTGSFRVRFSIENQFYRVDKSLLNLAEKHVISCSNLSINRVNPTTEIWYMIRSEGIGFYCQLIFGRKVQEKNLSKGELRPELANLMCGCAKLNADSIVCDPFCGYGAIPKELLNAYKIKKVMASDIDKARIVQLRKSSLSQNPKLVLSIGSVMDLKFIEDHTVDAVITDPPWGCYENIDNIEAFYIAMLSELKRITKKNATIVILSARKSELIQSCNQLGVVLLEQINTLVNGKKAAVFVLKID